MFLKQGFREQCTSTLHSIVTSTFINTQRNLDLQITRMHNCVHRCEIHKQFVASNCDQLLHGVQRPNNRSMFSVSPTNAFSAPPVRQSSILRRCCPQELKSSRAQELKRHPRIPLLLCPQSCSRLVDPILQYQLKLGNVKNIALPEGDALLGAFHFNRADALERNRLAVGCMVIRKVQWAL